MTVICSYGSEFSIPSLQANFRRTQSKIRSQELMIPVWAVPSSIYNYSYIDFLYIKEQLHCLCFIYCINWVMAIGLVQSMRLQRTSGQGLLGPYTLRVVQLSNWGWIHEWLILISSLFFWRNIRKTKKKILKWEVDFNWKAKFYIGFSSPHTHWT